MASPYQYPWVKFGSVLVQDIGSTELLLYTASSVTIFDSILVTNKTEEEIFIYFRIFRPSGVDPNEPAQSAHIANRRLVEKENSLELLASSQSLVTLQPGDFAYANSDDATKTFDCIISYRELNETRVEET